MENNLKQKAEQAKVKAEQAEQRHKKAIENLENARASYEVSVKELEDQKNALEKKIGKAYDEQVEPFIIRERGAETAKFCADKVAKDAKFCELLYGVPTLERMQELAHGVAGFWHTARARQIKCERQGVTVWGFTESEGSEAWYVAYKDACPVSALHVEKARHVGDTTYTKAFGVREVKPPNSGYSRSGYCMREWLSSEFVAFVGLTDTSRAEFEKKFFNK